MKNCTLCEEDRAETDFNFKVKKTGKRQNLCKFCTRSYYRQWDKDHPNRTAQRVTKRRKALSKWYQAFKTTLTCSHCPENHPACLEFHHLNPKSKDVHLSLAVNRGWSKERIMKEIAKCIVLCSNCHRKEHSRLSIDSDAVDL